MLINVDCVLQFAVTLARSSNGCLRSGALAAAKTLS
jgi:hypothetical protein